MSVKICTSEYMLSTVNGIGPRKRWFPGQPVKEVLLTSSKDGDISRAPDPVIMIDGDTSYLNNTPDPLVLSVHVVRPPREIVAQSPATVLIQEAWTWQVGVDPHAEYPSVMQNGFGGRAQIDRPEVSSKDLQYGKFFLQGDASTAHVDCGILPAGQALHFRYIAAVHTPGVWTVPSEFGDPQWVANAYYTRLRVYARPVGSA